ncbi:PilZ domain-containing protein [Sphingomicrobium lutaoense]|uniref:PilZ domain-containing protein n=1 Tax=Sphingomicrobium lutaoense TaxID=515949 RepID=UPI00389AFCA9
MEFQREVTVSGKVRREPRVAVDCMVKARESGQRETAAKLADLTRLGGRVELLSRLKIHDEIWIRLPGLSPIKAFVCWSQSFDAGLEFERPLHPAVFEHLLKTIKLS